MSSISAPPSTYCGIVSLLGLPNSGKSTLINTIVGQKISIISHKVQTTRQRILGIAISGSVQMLFMDTPGIIHHPKRPLDTSMLTHAWRIAQDADLCLMLMDARRKNQQKNHALLKEINAQNRPVWLVLNKIDTIKPKTQLLEIMSDFKAYHFVEKFFMISALTGQGVDDLKDALVRKMPPGPWLYPPEYITDSPKRVFTAELTREVLWRFLHQEIPYQLYVETEHWEKLNNHHLKIHQVIYVQRAGHKKILLGAQGQTIKKLGMLARQSIAKELGQPVHLFLHIKVSEDWEENPAFYKQFNLPFKK